MQQCESYKFHNATTPDDEKCNHKTQNTMKNSIQKKQSNINDPKRNEKTKTCKKTSSTLRGDDAMVAIGGKGWHI